MSKPSKQVQSLARGLAILELAARHPQGLRLSDIAIALSVEPSSAHVLAATLVAGGYLQKTERPVRYFLGPAVLTLAGRYSHRGLLDHAEAVFHDLQKSYPTATLTLAQYIAPEIAVVLRSNPERPGVIERPQERFMHPYGNATSLVFQAFWDDQQRQAYRQA
ncbi:MAG: hypothetical protein EHM48_07950, partial [Planctomycetaceae bacterium]